MTLAQVHEQAMTLTEEERVVLGQSLLESTGGSWFASPEIEEAWMREIDRRVQLVEEGQGETTPVGEVIEKLRRMLDDRNSDNS